MFLLSIIDIIAFSRKAKAWHHLHSYAEVKQLYIELMVYCDVYTECDKIFNITPHGRTS